MIMLKRTGFMTAVVLCVLCCGASLTRAQEASSEAKPVKTKVVQAYRLDFSFNELEGDKKINTRHYSMNLTSDQANEIKIGSRFPVPTLVNRKDGGEGQEIQYIDVGTSIWAQIRSITNSDEQELVVRSEISNLDVNPPGVTAPNVDPVIRQMKVSGSTILVEGKPLIVGSMDDPTSKRQFQLEVTVTKVR
jgi:Tfp pilus assembly major pilin PilA